MDDAAAIREMVRAARPGGVVCVINLCAYGQEDQEEYEHLYYGGIERARMKRKNSVPAQPS